MTRRCSSGYYPRSALFERVARIASLCAAVAGCGVTPAPLPPAPPGDACQAAQTRLTELACPEAQLRPGRSFGAWCADAETDGRHHHPECVARIRTCQEFYPAATGELCQ
jgi:hypothetical protein